MNPARALALLLLLPALGRAQAAAGADLLTYQGRLKDSGLPVTGARLVDISLCDQETGGTCYSTAGQSVGVVTGLFRTTFTSSVNLAGGPWFLAVTVSPNPPLTPRERLTAAPYAVYAASAGVMSAPPGQDQVLIASH